MEFFMIKTGFYDIVTRKEGERRWERAQNGEEQKREHATGLKVTSTKP